MEDILLFVNYNSINLKTKVIGDEGRDIRNKQKREDVIYHDFAYIMLSIHPTNQPVIKTPESKHYARLVLT